MIWQRSHRAETRARLVADRHYNRQKPGTNQFVPPGRCLVLYAGNAGGEAVWVTSWPFAEYVKHAWGGAWVCSAFRNEGAGLASTLIRQAVAATRAVYGDAPPLGLVTFLDRSKVRPTMVRGQAVWGWTWRKAGFRECGETKSGLLAMQLLPEDMPPPEEPNTELQAMSAPFEAKAKRNGATEPVFTVSTANSAEARTWRIEDRRTLTWGGVCRALLNPRTAPVGGVKDGLCFSPAVFTGTRRVAAEVAGISLLVADIDCGLDIGDIVPLLRASGYAWAVGSTHGHMKREFTKRFAPETWARLLEAFGTAEGVALAWAQMHFVPAALAGGIERVAVSSAAEGKAVVLEMVLAHPVPRWRVVVPLAAPWLPPGGPGRAAGKVWSRAYLQAWAGLGLEGLIDSACADPPRLYFTGRQPALAGTVLAGGLVVRPEFYAAKAEAPLAPLAALVGAPPRSGVAGAVEAMTGARETFNAIGETGHEGARKRLPGGDGHRTYAPWLIDRPGLGEIDLEQWHHTNGTELMLARLIEEREPGMLDGSRPDSASGRVHIECPKLKLHSSDGRGGTFCWNGSGWMARGSTGRERGGMHCMHAACSGTTQGRWLGALLECGAVGWDDLDAAALRVSEKRGRAAMADMGDSGAVPPSSPGANRDDPRANGGTDAAPASADQAASPGSGAEGMPGDRPGVASCPIPPADDSAIVQAIRLGREAAMAAGDEEAAARAELQFQATERFVCERIGGRFYDLRATGIEASQALNRSVITSVLVAVHGYPKAPDTLVRWMQWDMIRRRVGLAWCVVDGITYQPAAPPLVHGAVKGWLCNLWRPGPLAWPQAVGDDDPAVVDLLALVTNVTGDDRERDGLLWWMGDMLVRAGRARVLWGPLNFGPQGCGKSLLLRAMVALVGQHNATVVPFRDFVRGSENIALMKQLTGIEEAGMVGRRGFESKVDFYDFFKPYYTAEWLQLSQKYASGQDVRLYTRIPINANDAHALAIPPEDRRIWPMRARGGKLDAGLAVRLDGRIGELAEAGKWIRWLCDAYPGLTARHGFSPFRCPTDDVASEVKQEMIEETLPVAAQIAADVVRAREEEGRTVLTFDEVVRAVWARMRLDAGERPPLGQVRDGVMVGGWTFVMRGRPEGRASAQRRFWARSAHVEKVGLGYFTIKELSRRYSEETKSEE